MTPVDVPRPRPDLRRSGRVGNPGPEKGAPMNCHDLFSEEQLDYLVEILNIGAGNATTALHHLLKCEVNMKMPDVEVMQAHQVPAAIGDPSSPVAGVNMR